MIGGATPDGERERTGNRRLAGCTGKSERAHGVSLAVRLRRRGVHERVLAPSRDAARQTALALSAGRRRSLCGRARARRNADDAARQFPERRLRSVPALAAARSGAPNDSSVSSTSTTSRSGGMGQWPWPRARDGETGRRARAAPRWRRSASTFCFRRRIARRPKRPRRGRPSAPARTARRTAKATRLSPDALAGRSVVLSELVTQTKLAGAVPRQERLHLHRPGPHARSAASQRRAWAADDSRQERGGNRLRQLAGRRRPGGAPRAAADRRQRPDSAELRHRVPAGRAGRLDLSRSNRPISAVRRSGQGGGVAAIKVGDLIVPTQPAGDIRAYFAATDPEPLDCRRGSCSSPAPISPISPARSSSSAPAPRCCRTSSRRRSTRRRRASRRKRN